MSQSFVRNYFCYRRKNGVYSLWDCSNYYIKCSEGMFMMEVCDGDLVFNPETSECDSEKNVKMCSYIPTTTVPTTTTTQDPEIQARSVLVITMGSI